VFCFVGACGLEGRIWAWARGAFWADAIIWLENLRLSKAATALSVHTTMLA
jgi:hypothetical protein